MIKNIRQMVENYKKQFGVSAVTEKALCESIMKQGYTVVYFNKIFNNENVSQVVENLNLGDLIECHKGFTFANDKYRLVFVNEDLSKEEQTLVLAHEVGHIYCEHTGSATVLGQDVKQEHEANEFAHYLLHPSKTDNAKLWMARHKKLIIATFACLLAVAIGLTIFTVVSKEQSYYGEYYVTSTGSKYHEKDCIFVKNKTDVRRLAKEEFESGDYEPCKTCLP